jgi:metal-dependent amidase/aminoacylase/carboxypeptidase family protein
VVSVCRFSGGTNGNVIPDTAELEGTIRYLDRRVGDRIGEHLEQIVSGACAAAGAHYDLRFERTYIPTVNDRRIVLLGRRVARRALGAGAWRDIEEPSMGAEDFAFYLQDYPGAMFRLGLGEDSPPLHSPHFDFNDAALENGIVFLVSAALAALE